MKAQIRHMAEDAAAIVLVASWIFAWIVLFTLESCTHPIEKWVAFAWIFAACPAAFWSLCDYVSSHE